MLDNARWTKELEMLAGIISKQPAGIISKQPLDKTIKWGGEVFTYNGKNVVRLWRV